MLLSSKNILDPSTGLPLVNHQMKGITCIADVSYSVVPGLLSNAEVHELLGGGGGVSLKRTSSFMESHRSSLPDEWGRLLNSDETCELSTEHSSFRITDPKTKENIPTAKMTTKIIYDILIRQSDDEPIKRHKKWEYNFSYPINRTPVWTATYDNFSENRFCDLHWRVLHRAYRSPLRYLRTIKKARQSVYCALTIRMKLRTIFFFLNSLGSNRSSDTLSL